MRFSVLSFLTSAAAVSAAVIPSSSSAPEKRGGSISVTPHDSYSSSIGVLGCKINTNRAAYWPSSPDCNNICVKVSANGRSVNLLKVDQSGGAHDISYDAWNYLSTGKNATEAPTAGGGLAATYEDVPMSECAHLLKDGKHLAFAAANSMNFITSCSANTWVGKNYALYNILNTQCTWGYDELCRMPDPSQGNQPICEHTLGLTVALKTCPVYNIAYPTGKLSIAV
ncbi:uncharacterized protein GGS22DRAFT_173171 [Annulohypoxylon maeteangense]|uniref:uncharacterized protein n=1 Tax=Annulohypoxylon maeteangense TaxID=1927788 RepID=UPI0020078EA0|nr:uncharacterized protein GGS22DRAFT_173171 [Annulohypoxylon maeteangense]KAI0881032.1 hypothetical protein GGS22DRAFT_173171 [Annulohypoxylon maeteangense]